jgi:hypothetical protein
MAHFDRRQLPPHTNHTTHAEAPLPLVRLRSQEVDPEAFKIADICSMKRSFDPELTAVLTCRDSTSFFCFLRKDSYILGLER